jgi:hypothetical protein
MRKLIRVLAAGASAAALSMGLPAVAGAGPDVATCTGVLAPGTYQKVIVPGGAACFSDGPVTIRSGLFVEAGATFVLGSEEAPGNNGTISGGVHATGAANVQLHFVRINGGVDIRGGAGPFGDPFGVTWNTIEDSQINGDVTIQGYDGFWMGFIRNNVNGSVHLNDNVLADPDGNEYVTNTIHGSLQCSGNSPAPQVGDSEGLPNQVTGQKSGQCTNV